MEKKYIIECNEKHLATIANGLEFYSRFLAGQWEIPEELQWSEYSIQGKPNGFWNTRNEVEDDFKMLKTKFMKLNSGEFYGIGSDKAPKEMQVAYDIYRPILEEFHKGSDSWNVYSSPGLAYSNEGRIKVKLSDELGN